ncbi:hypothetical protein B9Z55_015153 [Caenorhabditis nigoni]|nr:hypothetical protein B9Z55_015153 [Caenorhabditis nigoni]
MSYQDIDEFTESLLIFIKGFSQYGHTWKRLLEPPTVWRFVLKLIAESDDIKEEQSNVHQLSRTLAHMSEKSRYNSHSCIESCHDAEYFVKRILSILVPSDNWTAKIVCDTIDFLASSELGARLLVVNGAVRQIKDRINIGKDHAGSKSPIRVWHFSLKHVLQLLEKDENFEEWIDERMTKALAIRRSTDARFSYHESTCFLVAVLEILTGNNAIWKVMKNSYKHNPGKEKLSHRIVSRALNKLWSNPSKAFRTGVMMEFLEGMCLGLEVVDGIGGRSEILLEFMVNSDMEALRLFQFEYSIFNEHGNFKRTILRLSSKEIDNGKESYFLNGKTFSICPQFLAIYYTDIKASVHFLPLHLNTPSGVIQYELYSAISKTIDKQVLHVKTIILIDGEFWLINSGSKSRYTIRSIPNATVAVYEKKMDN